MRIIEIASLDNGAHRNQTVTFCDVPNGWAVIPDDMETPNFPFGKVTVDDTKIPPVVTGWTAGTIPEPEPEPEPTPAQQRENAYNAKPCVAWDNTMLTVTEASQKWQYYAAEGNTTKTDELTALIAEAKETIRNLYPDKEV